MKQTRTKLNPLEDRVVIEPVEPESKTPGGIILPDVAKEKSQRGVVLAVGPGRFDDAGRHIAVCVCVGDTVVYSQYGGSEVEVNGKKFRVVRESDILAVEEAERV